MYAALYAVIIARLAALGYSGATTALGGQPALPAVQAYLADDREVAHRPMVIRELRYAVQVTVGHSDTAGAAQTEALAIMDTIMAGFAGWRPPGVIGIQGEFAVPQVRLEKYEDHGAAVYLATLVIRAIPDTFAVS